MNVKLAIWIAVTISLIVAGSDADAAPVFASLPSDFVDLHSVAPQIVIDMRYATDHDFAGHPMPGYEAAKCLLTRPTALALSSIESDLAPFGLSLKVYDCYRPQRAVDFFVRWAADARDQKMKKEFYPHIDKADLIRLGYIASPSAHSRGSTVDLTIVPLPYWTATYDPHQPLVACDAPASLRFADGSLDMGTGYDCFDPKANTHAAGIIGQERANRMLLATEMIAHGFQPYKYEWWHFTLKNEPYPDTCFDAPIR
ncbi:MAG TPA: M15 family metallopeptidase [Candidatus Binataceae bacterium]|nr:M15 family metallopeptidase [Candidatus Binataceae bacterium]